jgi:hypothetical protein
MIYDLIMIMVDYIERRMAYAIIGGDQPNAELFLLTFVDDITKGTPSTVSSTKTTTTTTTTMSSSRPSVTGWRRPTTVIQPTGSPVKLGSPAGVCALLPFPLASSSLSSTSPTSSLVSKSVDTDDDHRGPYGEHHDDMNEVNDLMTASVANTRLQQQYSICFTDGLLPLVFEDNIRHLVSYC